jgi:hypothetical protein
MTMPFFRQLYSSFSIKELGYNPVTVHMEFVVYEVALQQAFSPVT